MKNKVLLILLCIFVVGSIAFSLSTEYSFAEDGLYEDIDEVAKESGDPNFIKFMDNYEVDTQKISFFKDPGSVLLNMATNFIFTLQKDLAKLLIVIFNFAMSTNMSSLLETFIQPFISAMKGTIFDRFAIFMISICAFIYLVRMITSRHGQVISNILSLLLIIVIAFAFYAYPDKLLNTLESVSTEVANSVMDAPYDAIGGDAQPGAKTSTGKSASVIWNMFVHKPWQIIEFGSVKKAHSFEADILKYKPGSDERKEKVEELASKEELFSKSLTAQTGRCITALILFIINVILMVVLLLFCLLILGFQFLLLAYMMLGIFVFLLSLIPYYGIELVKRWGMRLLSTSCIKILLVFFLSLLMVFMSVIYGFTDRFGLLKTLVLILVMTATIYLKRNDIMGLFSNFSINSLNPKAPEQIMNRAMNQDLNAIKAIRDMNRNLSEGSTLETAKNVGSSAAKMGLGSAGISRNYDSEIRNNSGAENIGGDSKIGNEGTKSQQTDDREQDVKAYQAVRMPYSKYKDEYSDCRTLGDYDPESKLITVFTPMKKASDSLYEYTQDLGRFFRKAEELLESSYEKSKEEAEQEADLKGTEPKYSNFVNRTDAVRSLGAGHFDPRDLSKTASMLRSYEEKGGDSSQITATSKGISYGQRSPEHQMIRPKDISEIRSQESRPNAVSTVNAQQLERHKGIEYFKHNFGEEKGEKFYENLQGKYDAVQLDTFSSEEKLTYAQVQKLLKNGGKQNNTEEKKKVSNEEPLKIRE